MHDSLTPAQKRELLRRAQQTALDAGWVVVEGWTMSAPSGSVHDLSGADMTQLDRIERENLFLAR